MNIQVIIETTDGGDFEELGAYYAQLIIDGTHGHYEFGNTEIEALVALKELVENQGAENDAGSQLMTRETLPNGKYCYRLNGEIHIKQSSRLYTTAQVHQWPDGDICVTMGKTKGGGNRYMRPYWVKEIEIKAI